MLKYFVEQLRPGARALDVGCGSGYITACMGHLVGPEGKAIGIERLEELVRFAIHNIERDPATRPLLESGTIEIRCTQCV